MNILVNDVFEPVTEFSVLSTMARAIHLDEKNDALVVMDLTDPPKAPYLMSLEELRGSLVSGDTKPVVMAIPEFLLVLEEDLEESARRDRDQKWALIAPLLDSAYPGQIFVHGEMGRLVSGRAAEVGVQRKTRRRQKLSATPDLSGTVLPLCLIPNSALKSAPPFKSVVPKASACAGLPA